jgi:hypothetical protein
MLLFPLLKGRRKVGTGEAKAKSGRRVGFEEEGRKCIRHWAFWKSVKDGGWLSQERHFGNWHRK